MLLLISSLAADCYSLAMAMDRTWSEDTSANRTISCGHGGFVIRINNFAS